MIDTNITPINKDKGIAYHQRINDAYSKDNRLDNLDNSLLLRTDYLKQSVKGYLVFLVDPTFVLGHIVKIIICLALLCYMMPASVMTDLYSIKKILQAVLVAAVGWQIIISSIRSMLIPIISIATAIIVEVMVKNYGMVLPFETIVLQYLLAAGVAGIGVAVFFRPSL